MYLLDNNVISELRKAKHGKANQGVIDWFKTTKPNQLYTSIIVMIELERWGMIKAIKDPVQGETLALWYKNVVKPMFENRVLMVDWEISSVCAKLHTPNPKPEHDALIGATAIAHDLILVTRNIKDFANMPVKLIQPFYD